MYNFVILPRFSANDLLEADREWLLSVCKGSDVVLNDFLLDGTNDIAYNLFVEICAVSASIQVYPVGVGNLKLFVDFVGNLSYRDETIILYDKEFVINGNPNEENSFIVSSYLKAKNIPDNLFCLDASLGKRLDVKNGRYASVGYLKNMSKRDCDTECGSICFNGETFSVHKINDKSVSYLKYVYENGKFTDAKNCEVAYDEVVARVKNNDRYLVFIENLEGSNVEGIEGSIVNDIEEEQAVSDYDLDGYIASKLSPEAMLEFERIRRVISA